MAKKVYFAAVEDSANSESLIKVTQSVFEASGARRIIGSNDLLAVKIHVGEKGNVTHVSPDLVAEIVRMAKTAKAHPFLTETSTLYRGQRENAVKHILLAHDHGFSLDRVGAPFIMADGLAGNSETEVIIDGKLNDRVGVAREVLVADALIVISHITGHIGTGLGGCIKNLGMGLASRMGKMRQHSGIRPEVIPKNCQFCRKCARWCPQDAIIEKGGKSFILLEKCIGCGECLAVCRFGAVKYDWGRESAALQKSMAEHALGAVKDKQGKAFYFNCLIDMTRDCDCAGSKQKKLIPDLGILASDDPVAIDKATLDITREVHGKNIARLSYSHLDPMVQLRHAESIGLGSLTYKLVKVHQQTLSSPSPEGNKGEGIKTTA
jgi:uncharacterized Fe-S center protein